MSKVKVWNGTTWVEKPAKVYIGGVWTPKPVRHWDGAKWSEPAGGPVFTYTKVGDSVGNISSSAAPISGWEPWPYKTTSVPVLGRYLVRFRYSVSWTDTQSRNYQPYIARNTTASGNGAATPTVDLGGGKWGATVDTCAVGSTIFDPAGTEYELRPGHFAAGASAADCTVSPPGTVDFTEIRLRASLVNDYVCSQGAPGYAVMPLVPSDMSGFYWEGLAGGQRIMFPRAGSSGGTLSFSFTLVASQTGTYTINLTSSPGNSTRASLANVALEAGVPYLWEANLSAAMENGTNGILRTGYTVGPVGSTVTFKAGGTLIYTP